MTRPVPLPYQRDGVNAIRAFGGRVLLADEMGLGKTLQALWYLQHSKSAPAIVVCPASLKATWRSEAAKLGMVAEVVSGTKAMRDGFALQAPSIVVVNYDILHAWVDRLRELRPVCVVFDECHAMQNPSRRRSKAGRKLAKGVDRVIAISGTPITNRPKELWATLNILWPDKYPKFSVFGARYCRPRMTPWGWDYSGSQNLRELHTALKSLGMIRRYKKDVLLDLPEKSQRVLVVPLSDPDEYRRVAGEVADAVRALNAQAAVGVAKRKMSMLEQVSILKLLAAKLKRRAMVEHFDQYMKETGEKIVVSCIHHKMIDSLRRYYGERCVVIDGRVPPNKRAGIVNRFQTDPGVRVFIGQIQAAGVGLTLTAASTVWFAELGYRPGDHSQMADRVHRIGQHYPCQAIYVVAEDTIEQRFCELLQRKQVIVTSVMDGTKDIGDFDIADQLIREMAAGV